MRSRGRSPDDISAAAVPHSAGMDASGWVAVEALIGAMKRKPTLETVKELVASSDKRRFVLDLDHEVPRIRAAQGHTVVLEAPVLTRVTDPAQVPLAVHGTSMAAFELIRQSGHLLRMQRTHVHFSTLPAHLRKGDLRAVVLRLDVRRALESGLELFLSTNQVCLCEGPVPLDLLTRVDVQDLGPEWAALDRP